MGPKRLKTFYPGIFADMYEPTVRKIPYETGLNPVIHMVIVRVRTKSAENRMPFCFHLWMQTQNHATLLCRVDSANSDFGAATNFFVAGIEKDIAVLPKSVKHVLVEATTT